MLLPVLCGLSTGWGEAATPPRFPTTMTQANVNEGLGFGWVSPHQQWAYALEDGELALVSPGDLLTPFQKTKPSSRITSNGVFSPDGEFLFLGTLEGKVLLFQSNGQELAASPVCFQGGPGTRILSLAMNQHKELLVSCEDDRVLLCDATDPKRIVLKRTFLVDVEQAGQGASAIAMSPAGGAFVIANAKKKATLWKQEPNGEYKPLWTHAYAHVLTKALYSPEGQWLLLANGEKDNEVFLTDVPTGRQHHVLFTQPAAWGNRLYHFRFVPEEWKVEAITSEIGGDKKYIFDIKSLYANMPLQCLTPTRSTSK